MLTRQSKLVFALAGAGVNSFIIKPVTFAGLVEVMRGFSRYWFEIVELPVRAHSGRNGRP